VTDSSPKTHDDETARAGAVLDELSEAYADKYGEVVFDVRPRALPDGTIELSGRVLLPAQRDAALQAVGGAVEVQVRGDIQVLTESRTSVGWMTALRTADVLNSPHGERETQVTPDDPPVRILLREEEFPLVELADGTVGWVDSRSWQVLGRRDEPEDVGEWRRSWLGAVRRVPDTAWRSAASDWLGVPYLWGGTTVEGIDCSGLSQRLYRLVAGVGLPRHSLDQMRRGARVPLDDLAPGDLVVLQEQSRRWHHVAIVLDGDQVEAVHASRNKGVVVERLDGLLGRYRFLSARRFTETPGPGGPSP
jgi:lipoprotein Spr